MKRTPISIALIVLGLGALASTASAQHVTGDLTDSQRKVVFKGAFVRINELGRSATSDDRGRFRLNNVPAGSYTLVVSYVGAADTSIPIVVPAEGLNMGDVVLGTGGAGAASIEEVVVYGQSAAIASGLNQERSADNLMSVLDTDAMGQFPDQNVAESLRRLPGVSVTLDQGEGRYVMIRGMDPDLNATSINGVRATAAEPRRALQLDVIPSDVLDGLEVSKTLTPDMDGDAIGGSINVKTLSAFSRKGAYAKARVEGQYNELREAWNPKVSFAGSNIFEMDSGRRLGVAGAISWNDRKLHIDNNEADDWAVADNGSDFTEEFQPRLYTVERERIGGVLNFDLDVSDSTALHLYTLYSKFTDTELRNRMSIGLDGLDESTVTDSFAEYSEVEIERDTKGRDKRGQIAENLSISLGSSTQLDTWLIEANLGYSYARERTPDQVSGTWVAEFESGDGPIAAADSVLSIDHSNPQLPVIDSAYASVLTDASLYELDEIEHSAEKNEDTQTSLRLDATRDTGWGSLKFGAKARWREKKTDELVEIWSGDDMWFLSDAVLPGGGESYNFSTPMDPVPDNDIERDILASGVGIEFEDLDSEVDSNVADFVYDENVYAAYVMGTWEGDRTTLVAGLRYEYTDLDNRGNVVVVTEEDQNGPGDPPEDTVTVTPIQAKRTYSDVLPSVNLRFEFNERLIGRASVHRAVVRPRIEHTAFRVEIDGDEAELGNPELDPFRAWNADISLAWYPTELSVISGGVFYKKIEEFIFVQTLDDYDWQNRTFDEATIALNGEDATVVGVEINYQQHFGFLGAPFDAFIVGINYTYVDSEGDTGDRKVPLPKQSASLASVMLGYDKHGLDLRLAMKYRDRFVDELVEEDYDRYAAARTQWDFTAKYRFNNSWQMYGEFTNITNEPDHYYAGRSSRLYQYDEFGSTYALGVQYNFQ